MGVQELLLDPATRLRSEAWGSLAYNDERRTLLAVRDPEADRLPRTWADCVRAGLSAPICLSWEWTYSCNLNCVHCLSASGRRDPAELRTAECLRVMDQLAEMKVFYVNVGGGEPMVRPDFWELMQGAVARGIGVKFSTNGTRLGLPEARRLAAMRHVDVQVSLDGATAPVNDRLRGAGSFDRALAALDALALAGFAEPKISVVVTRENASQLDHFKALADRHGAVLRLTRLRPAGRGARIWEYLRPTADQLRSLHEWLLAEGRAVMTGDSFFHLSAFGGRLPGMNLCAAARAVCLIDPVGGVYACPFAVDSRFRAGSLRDQGLSDLWQAPAFQALRVETVGGLCRACPVYAACGGGCPAAK
ncbi:MAG: mycofactocin radical SAM maturase, partial [Bifidobacteriaceae bacterium]|nr:mycofactocin radical SAM maturase [Bifidobacteriaceae bacterium]